MASISIRTLPTPHARAFWLCVTVTKLRAGGEVAQRLLAGLAQLQRFLPDSTGASRR